jgi:fibronectin type 3 domain-containing protein
MRLKTRFLSSSAVLLTALLASCDSPTRPPTEGSIRPRINMVRADTALYRVNLPFDSVFTRLYSGGAPVGAAIGLELSGGTWSTTVTGLTPANYDVEVLGYANDSLQHWGRTNGIPVAAGAPTTPSVTFTALAPNLAPPAATTFAFTATITFPVAIAGATGYRVEASKSNTFSSGVFPVETTGNGATTLILTLPDTGTWYYRAKPLLPSNNALVRYSDHRSFQLLPAASGRTPGTANNLTLTIGAAGGSMANRNITLAGPDTIDYFTLPGLRAGDTLTIEAVAGALTPPSPLNPHLLLLRANGVDTVALDDDGGPGSDALIKVALPATETYIAIVSGTAGHYEFRYVVRRNPAMPTAFLATVTSPGNVHLSWTDNAGANDDPDNGYEIYRCAGAGCTPAAPPAAPLATTAANATSYDDATAVVGQEYTYRIRARQDADHFSALTATSSVSLVVPAAPSVVTATTISSTQVDLGWSDNSATETGFEIQRCVGAACNDFTTLTTAAADVEAFTDLTVAYGFAYRYQIRAISPQGNSSFAGPVAASTEPPATPTLLTAVTVDSSRITLGWVDNATNETGFRMERCATAGCVNFAEIGTTAANVAAYIDSTAVPGTDYRYRVRAYHLITSQDYSNIADADTRPAVAPSSLVATVVTAAVQLAWNDNANDELLTEVERCVTSACTYALIATLPGAGVVAYTDNTAAANTDYTYRVRARNEGGYSPYSNVSSVVTTIETAPSGLSATTISGTQIDLAWTDNSSTENGFYIERCIGGGCTDWAPIVVTGADAQAYSDVSVAIGVVYRYQVRARTAYGLSLESNAVSATTELPAAPTTLVATTLSNTSIGLTWVDLASTESSYTVERCATAGCSNFAVIATLPADAVDFTDTGLASNESYTYRVQATNAVGPSPYSNESTATTNLPGIPGALAAEVTAIDAIRLTWVDNANDELDQRLEMCSYIGGPVCSNFVEIATIAANAILRDETSLVAGTTYRYRLRARNGAGYSDYSNEVTITAGVPAAVSGLFATTVSGTRIDLAWGDASDNELRFIIERCSGGGCVNFASLDTVGIDVITYIDNSVILGNTYRYRILAENGAGGAAFYSNTTEANTLLPDAPTGLAATTFSSTRIDLAWADGGPYETSYELERCQGDGCTNFALILTTGADVGAYTDSPLTPGLTFRYRIRAVNAVGVSPYEGPVDATTNLPADPTALVAVASSSSSVDLSWTDNANNETDYIVERCQGVGCGSFSFLTLLAANVDAYTDGTVVYGETYRYRVQAVGSSGSSQYSTPAGVAVLEPATPPTFQVTTTSGTQITLAWGDAADNEVTYRIERCAGVGCVVFGEIASVPANTTGYADNSVVLNQEYTYRVRARNAVGDSPYTVVETTDTFTPVDPSGLLATTISADRIDLTWTDNSSNETAFRIERCVGAGCSNFTFLADAAANATTYQDLGLAAEESFTYRLTAVNVAGNSATIGPVSATTVLPLAPTALTAVVASPTSIDLAWTDNATNEGGYRIERCAGAGCSSFVEIATVGPNVTNYTSTGLAGNSFYSHRVRAFNAAGTSTYSATALANTFTPGAPSGLAGQTQTATAVTLTWNDNSSNEAGFRIERCSGVGCASFAEISTVGAGEESYVDLAAPSGVSVSYRVRAYNGVGNSSYSGTATVSTTVPATPTAAVATAQGQTQIQVTWVDNATDEASYLVERCTGAACTNFQTLVELLPAGTTSHTDLTVTAGNTYRYRVFALGNGMSGASNETEASTILPAAPTTLVATAVSDNRVDLTWTDNADNETNYRVERCTGVGCTGLVQIAMLGANAVGYTDLSATIGNTYRYVVLALNDAGVSPPSDTASAATDIPGLPTALTATVVTAVQIDLAWTDNATTETGFSIERCTGDGCSSFAEIIVVGANVVAFNDNTVAPSTTYRYRVRAVNGNGASGYTNIAEAATNAPAQPTGLAAVTVSAGQVDLTWTDAANNEASYEIERCDFGGCTVFAQIGVLGPDAQAYSDLTTTVGNTYTYRVRAVNAAGNSPYSLEVTVTTLVPADPTSLVATTISATRIDLTWTDNADNESAVRVERCVGGGCTDFALVVSLPPNTQAHNDEGLTAGLLYRYRIVMTNAAGSSNASNEAQASTDFPLPPTALTALTIGDTKIDLAWTDNSGNEDGFEVERCVGVGCSDFTLLIALGSDVTAYLDNTTSLGNSYSYRVRALNFAGASDFTNIATANTFVPADPTIVSAVATSTTTSRITWATQAATAGYLVERCDLSSCSFTQVADVVHPTDFFDDVVTTGVTYRYRVRAYNAAGQSGTSAELDLNMSPPASASGVVGIALSGTQAYLTWSDNASDETLVRVQRCSGAGCVSFTNIATLDADDTDFQDDGLAPAGVYVYRVIPENAVGAAAPSPSVEVSLNAPQAPTGLGAATVAPGQINIGWVDNSNRELSYAVERCTGPICVDFVQVASLGQDVNSYANTGLDLNAVYRFRVRALNNVGPSAYSNIATANTLLPAAATALTATTVHGNRIDLGWADNSSNESGFRIQRCLGGGCSDFVQIATVGVNVISFIDNTAAYGQSYNYRVLAANVSGDAAPTNTATASTFLPQVSGITATTLDRTSISVQWADLGLFEQQYQVFRCEGPGCSSFSFLGAVGGGINTFTDATGAPATDYTYQVRAATIGGVSSFSVGAGARTPIDVLNGALISIPADTFQSRRHWVVNIPPGLSEFRVSFTPIGFEDPDLYVRRGAAPTVFGQGFFSDTLCAPYSSGVETCTFTNPPAGDIYIAMHGYSAYSGGTISVNVQYQFATCGTAGNVGPGQAACDASYLNSNLNGAVTVAGGIQTWTVPYDGVYEVTAIGAQGASSNPIYVGGLGAVITGRFNFTAGTVLKLAVGQMGTGQGSNSNAGGGGGSFVVDNGDNPLLVAGGGGGSRTGSLQNACNASLTNFGIQGSGASASSPCTVKVVGLANGGAISVSWGAAGAGFFSNGADDAPYGAGGRSWGNGLFGGAQLSVCSGINALGGFGGGGAGNGCLGGGGGGGYSGGDGGWIGGGGGSYNTGTSPTAGHNGLGGHGSIRVRWISP